MDAWSVGSLLVIDVRVNVLCWFRFSPGKTSFSEWHIQGLQSPCPTRNGGFGAGGKRHRKQQCWAGARAVAGRREAEPCAFPGWGTSSEPGWGLMFGIGARHRQLGVTWVSWGVLCSWLSCLSSWPLGALQLQHTAFPGSAPPGCFLWKKNPSFCLMQGGDNFIRALVSMSLAPPGLFVTTSVTMSCVTYPRYLYQKYRNNHLIPLCRAFWFNLSLVWTMFLIIWYFMKTSCPGVRDHVLIFWCSAPDSHH